MNQAIEVILNDMKQHAELGQCALTYTDEHVRCALIAAGINPDHLFVSPAFLWGLALEDLCEKAMKQ